MTFGAEGISGLQCSFEDFSVVWCRGPVERRLLAGAWLDLQAHVISAGYLDDSTQVPLNGSVILSRIHVKYGPSHRALLELCSFNQVGFPVGVFAYW